MKGIVVGIGEILWDMLPDGKKLGGAPANFAYHVSQFGLAGKIVSAVGHDILGAEVIEALNCKQIDYCLPVVDFPTGVVNVELDGAGIPCYDIKKNVAWDNIPYTGEIRRIAAATCAVCFGSLAQRSPLSRSTINSFIDAIPRSNDTLIVFDGNLRQDFYDKELLCESMRKCNVLKINDEELVVISAMFDIYETSAKGQCEALVKKFDLKMLILTCGVNGSYVYMPSALSFQPTPRVEVADTVGAGDSFTAAFISSILRGHSVEEAHRIAVATSAYVCTQKGAMPVLPPELTA